MIIVWNTNDTNTTDFRKYYPFIFVKSVLSVFYYYGAKGIGEIGLVPTAAAVANAYYQFDGVKRLKLPLDKDWIVATIQTPDKTVDKSEKEIHYFKKIIEFAERCLKVVYNPLKNLVVTAHFDRKMTKKNCK